jgi:hypothetical protein
LNVYLGHRRSAATCRNGGPHSGYRHLADKDEAAGSSPARPTIPGLTWRNDGQRSLSVLTAPCVACAQRCENASLHIVLGNDGSSVERTAHRQVLSEVCLQDALGTRWVRSGQCIWRPRNGSYWRGSAIRPPKTSRGATGGLVGPAREEFLPFLLGEAAAGDGAGPLEPGGGVDVP